MLKTLVGAGVAVAALAGCALADVAILVTPSQTVTRDEAREIGRMERPLNRAGFDVFKTSSADPDELVDTLVKGFERANPSDRVLIFLTGKTVRYGSQSYNIIGTPRRDADEYEPLALQRQALALSPVLDTLAKYPGRALLLSSTNLESVDLDGRGRPAIAGLPSGVALVEGRTSVLVRGLARLLDRPETPIATAFNGLAIQGYAPAGVPFLGQAAAVAEPSPEELAWQRARDRGTAEGYQAFLRLYPSGRYARDAERALSAFIVDPRQIAEEAERALGLDRQARRGVQEDLTVLGFDTRGVDGIFGAGSRRAIGRWQEDAGFDATGFLTGNQVVALTRDADRRRARIQREDADYWSRTGARGGADNYRAYLERYPRGENASRAREELAAIEARDRARAEERVRNAWRSARDANTASAYRNFLRTHPDSAFSDRAQERLAALEGRNPDRDTAPQGAAEEAIARDRVHEQDTLGNPIARLLAERQLLQLGLDPGAADGRFDQRTRRAITAFQRSRDLPPTGYIGRATAVALLQSASR